MFPECMPGEGWAADLKGHEPPSPEAAGDGPGSGCGGHLPPKEDTSSLVGRVYASGRTVPAGKSRAPAHRWCWALQE